MALPELTIEEYSKALFSSAPAPGGGAATALTAAQGISLIAMVCNLTVGKESYQDQEELLQSVLKQTKTLEQEALDLMDRDAESFGEVGKVYQMPKETTEDKARRKDAMEIALKGCTIPPMDLMELCVEGLALTKQVLGKTTPHAVSDLGVAALFFKSALEGAWLNVKINISHIKDEAFCQQYQERGQALLTTGKAQGVDIYNTVLAQL